MRFRTTFSPLLVRLCGVDVVVERRSGNVHHAANFGNGMIAFVAEIDGNLLFWVWSALILPTFLP